MNKHGKKHLTIAVSILALLIFSPFLYGQDDPTGDDGWEFILDPYFMFSGLSGNMTVNGVPVDLDMGFSDVMEYLDFGIAAHFEARKGKWGFLFDPMYMRLTSEGDTPDFIRIETTTTQSVVDMGVTYQLFKTPHDKGRSLFFDLLFGGRILYVKNKFDFITAGQSMDISKTWFDPYIGARVVEELTKRLSIGARGDIGGFKIGSDIAWNIHGFLYYQIHRNINIFGGWRIYGVDYEDGSGEDLFEYDVVTHGPALGFGFNF